MYRLIFEQDDILAASDYLREVIASICKREMDLSNLIITKSLSKDPSQYAETKTVTTNLPKTNFACTHLTTKPQRRYTEERRCTSALRNRCKRRTQITLP